MEIRRLPQGPGRNERRWRTDDATHAGTGPGEPVQLLSLLARRQARRGSRYGVARRDSACRAGMALLWAAAGHRRVATPGMDGEPEASVPTDARRQLAVRAAAPI